MDPLNQIAPEMAATYVVTTTRNIDRQLARPEPRCQVLFTQHYKRAVCGRVCGRPADVVRRDLEIAAHQGLAWFEMRGEPRRRARDVWEMRQVAGLLAAYGEADEYLRLDGLPVSRWYHPPDPEFEPGALAYRLFNRFLVTRKVAAEDLVAFENRMAQTKMHPVQAKVIAPVVHCLVAIQHEDGPNFENSWHTLTTAFAAVARFGEFSRRFEGLLDPMALGLLALGRRQGFEVSVESPYAPVALLTAPLPTTDPEPVGAA